MAQNYCGGVVVKYDDNGDKRIYKSVLLRDVDFGEILPKYMNDREAIIDSIKYLVNSLGMFSCRLVGEDQFDKKIYDGDDTNLISSRIIGGSILNLNYPYNLITHHTDNSWKMYCLNLEFQMKHNIIPFKDITFLSDNEYPTVIDIKRSSGKIQKGRIDITYGIIIKKSSTNNDTEDQIYFIVSFDIDDSIKELTNDSYLGHNKHVNLKDILELNSHINEIHIRFNKLFYSEYSAYICESGEISCPDKLKCDVLKQYDTEFTLWIENIVEPPISRLNCKNIKLIK